MAEENARGECAVQSAIIEALGGEVEELSDDLTFYRGENSFLERSCEEQSDVIAEQELCEKAVKSVIKKIIEKYCEHKDLIEDLRPVTEMYSIQTKKIIATTTL